MAMSLLKVFMTLGAILAVAACNDANLTSGGDISRSEQSLRDNPFGSGQGDQNPDVFGSGQPGSLDGYGQVGQGGFSDEQTVQQSLAENLYTSEGQICAEPTPGLVGKVFRLQPRLSTMPELKNLTNPIGQIRNSVINVPERRWSDGFPGHRDLIEWFGIRFIGMVMIPEAGKYRFKTVSDDGVRLYVNDKLVINDPGIRPTKTRETSFIDLPKGMTMIALDWWQGPRHYLGLQFYWQKQGEPYKFVDASATVSSELCDLVSIGSFQ